MRDPLKPVSEYPAKFAQAVEDVSDALDKLAAHGTPQQIRDHLVEKGVRGKPQACPVHKKISKSAGRYRLRVSTNLTHVEELAEDGRSIVNQFQLTNPLNVSQFISAFDAGGFPELELT